MATTDCTDSEYQKVVLFRFPKVLSREEELEFDERLRLFVPEIPGIKELSIGRDISGRANGYTHGLLIRFGTKQAYEQYHPHPTHQAFAAFVYQRNCEILSFNFPLVERYEGGQH